MESPRAGITPQSGTGASRVPAVLALMDTAGLASRPNASAVCQRDQPAAIRVAADVHRAR